MVWRKKCHACFAFNCLLVFYPSRIEPADSQTKSAIDHDLNDALDETVSEDALFGALIITPTYLDLKQPHANIFFINKYP